MNKWKEAFKNVLWLFVFFVVVPFFIMGQGQTFFTCQPVPIFQSKGCVGPYPGSNCTNGSCNQGCTTSVYHCRTTDGNSCYEEFSFVDAAHQGQAPNHCRWFPLNCDQKCVQTVDCTVQQNDCSAVCTQEGSTCPVVIGYTPPPFVAPIERPCTQVKNIRDGRICHYTPLGAPCNPTPDCSDGRTIKLRAMP